MDLSQEDWTARLKNTENATILDVRTAEECADGIIVGAICIDIYKSQGFIYTAEEQLDKSKSIFVYCRSGGRSAQACAVLNQLGFDKTYNLSGGFMGWRGEVSLP
jgi:rhodanese-related sulfurtransferase